MKQLYTDHWIIQIQFYKPIYTNAHIFMCAMSDNVKQLHFIILEQLI